MSDSEPTIVEMLEEITAERYTVNIKQAGRNSGVYAISLRPWISSEHDDYFDMEGELLVCVIAAHQFVKDLTTAVAKGDTQ